MKQWLLRWLFSLCARKAVEAVRADAARYRAMRDLALLDRELEAWAALNQVDHLGGDADRFDEIVDQTALLGLVRPERADA